MKTNHLFLTLLLLLTTSTIFAQNSGSSVGDHHFNRLAYASAIEAYLNDVDKSNKSPLLYKNLADSYYYNAKLTKAVKWYKKYVETAENQLNSEVIFRYAQALKAAKNYKASDRWMQKFNAQVPEELRASYFINNRAYLSKIKFHSGRHTIKNESFNTEAPEFAPAFYGDGELLFSSARDTSGVQSFDHLWTKSSFTDIFIAKSSAGDSLSQSGVTKLSKKINSKYNESTAIVTKDGNTMYFTRNNYTKKRFKHDDEGVNRLKLYKATKDGDSWANVEELPFNSNDYSVAHPALSPDEKQLYFASDMPGSLGLSDIFYVDVFDENSYGEPVNLGDKINTEGRDTYPFISASGNMYFASEGHVGLGGLDVFTVHQNTNEEVTKVSNLGEPINSSMDDFSYIIDDKNTGYFTSNRQTGKGSDDIYSFTKLVQYLSGEVKNASTNEVVANAVIKFKDSKGIILDSLLTDEKGHYKTEISPNSFYNLEATKDGFTLVTDTLNSSKEANKMFIKNFVIDEAPFNENQLTSTCNHNCNVAQIHSCSHQCTKCGGPINKEGYYMINGIKYFPQVNMQARENNKYLLAPIYFNVDKDVIRKDAVITLEKVLEVMKANVNLEIEVHSFCDSRNSGNYNDDLSTRRAKSTIEYLITRGINPNRINGKAFGESGLVNDCGNGIPCPESKHELNRRSEFIIIKE